jgi:hypothetical protein
MLLAEINGKTLEAARDSEDYLTSTVFGHLRYIPPNIFWPAFLAAAKSVDDTSLLAASGIDIASYQKLEIRFWRYHTTFGEPDILLIFTNGPLPPLVVIVEVKLWSPKSSTGENDQLIRYLGILNDLQAINVHVPDATHYLVYLTPKESLEDIKDSLINSKNPNSDRRRLFRVQWQDLLEAAKKAALTEIEPARTILPDVARFLHKMGLEYFNGLTLNNLPFLPSDLGKFYQSSALFQGFTQEPALESFNIKGMCNDR